MTWENVDVIYRHPLLTLGFYFDIIKRNDVIQNYFYTYVRNLKKNQSVCVLFEMLIDQILSSKLIHSSNLSVFSYFTKKKRLT